MTTNDGWIKLHRKILDWEWYDEHLTFSLFIYLLLRANHTPTKWRGITINRGQLVTSVQALVEHFNRKQDGRLKRVSQRVTTGDIRGALSRLKSTNELTIETNRQYSLITINNYCRYQDDNEQTNKRLTNDSQTLNKRLTTNKNEKKERTDTPPTPTKALTLKDEYNRIFGKSLKTVRGFEANLTYWLEDYTLEEIVSALEKAHTDPFWADKMTPEILLRRRTPNGEPVDRVGQLLNRKGNSVADDWDNWKGDADA